MTRVLQSLLLADGTSDRALIPVINWTLRELGPLLEFEKPRFFRRACGGQETTPQALARMYRPDILFIHRDAENFSLEERLLEIPVQDRIVPVVPVRMTEAWLLVDESAIRRAASNPNGTDPLTLPRVRDLEHLPAKTALHDLLRAASGKSRRRRRSFNVDQAVHRVAELIGDYGPLRTLPSYAAFRDALARELHRGGWT